MTLLCLTILLSGCRDQETALHLEVRPVLFDGSRQQFGNVGAPLDEAEHIAVHTICDRTGALETLPGTALVFDGTYRSYPRFAYGDEYVFNSMTLFRDDKDLYAYCQNEAGSYAKRLKTDPFPNDASTPVPQPSRPKTVAVPQAKQTSITKLMNEDALSSAPFEPQFIGIESPLFSSLAIQVQTDDRVTTYSRPYDPSFHAASLSLHVTESETGIAPMFVETSDTNASYWPLDDGPAVVPELVKTHPLPDELEMGKHYPLWDLSYDTDGKSVRQSISIIYEPPRLMTPSEVETTSDENADVTTIGYFHKTPLFGKAELIYIDTVQTTTTDGAKLKQMLQRAKPVDRAGEPADYPLFTLVEGVKSQVFDVTLHERSNKTDVYVTTDGKHFKLSSEDSAAWIALSPY